MEGVIAVVAVHDIGCLVAEYTVVVGAASSIYRRSSRENQPFDFAVQNVIDGAIDGVESLSLRLCLEVAGLIDVVGIIAVAAEEEIDAGAADEDVIAAAAGQRVVPGQARKRVVGPVALEPVAEIVARTGEHAGSGQRQVLEICAECVVGAGHDGIGRALICGFRHDVADIVQHVGVGAAAAGHAVGTAAAIERVEAGTADNGVIEG
jgi:hypothetical protein